MTFVAKHYRALALALGSILFLLAISWLPYRMPVPRAYSDSYVFGYNNRIAAILTAAAAVLLAFFGPRLQLHLSPGKSLTSSTLKKALAGSSVIGGGLYLLTRRLDGVNESIYLIDRIKLLLAGRVPYKDFEYAYGASFLYVPAWISRGLHLPVGDAYGVFWIGLVLLGTFLLYKVIGWVDVPSGAQRSIFLLFWIFSILNLFSFGVTYSLFRYVLPCFFALVVYRGLAPVEQPQPQPGIFLLPPLMYALLLLVSPELGITFAIGMSAFLVRFGHLKQRVNLVAFAVNLAAICGISYIADRCGVFYTLKAFSTGGFNLPVTPAPHILLLFLLIALSACYAGQRLRSGRPDALLVLIAVSACSLAAALGRCDPLHVLLNPMGVILAGSFLLNGLPRLRRVLWPAMWVVFGLFFFVTLVTQSGMQLGKAAFPALLTLTPRQDIPRVDAWVLARMTKALGPEAARTKFDAISAASFRGTYDVPAMFQLPPQTVVEAPFGFTPGRFGTYASPSIDEGYYFENENVLTPAAVARKISEMQAHPERPLILLPGRENACTVRVTMGRPQIGPPFYYPYRGRPVRDNDVTEPMCTFIRQNYHPARNGTAGTFGYLLWLPG
ncbi:MAG: hypothetical protein ACRYFU_00560 [Janthinobacterium lividum]